MAGIEKKINIPTNHVSVIFGNMDGNIVKIEKELDVTFVMRGESIKILGETTNVKLASNVIKELIHFAEQGDQIDEQLVDYTLGAITKNRQEDLTHVNQNVVTLTYQGKPIKAKTSGQQKYVELIKKNMVVFGMGPAGTGKTYLAMAMAVDSFKRGEVSKIILTRPAIEAGEKLGFLPGDLQSKVDPYLRPLYDALFEIMGPENFDKNMEKGLIEVAPLAYMRGRTLNNAFIVLDEAQNTTPQQMKMFLTRLGFNSKTVVTGDMTQIDLPSNQHSGLFEAYKVLSNVSGIGMCHLDRNDVIRHPIVQKIVDAYELYLNGPKK
ncbi:PhoH family protein [Candidatus Epulonipiscium viviparus]|uniref:PhoH family protein n=1 Tax=Candidatus Epulonipiscium viviparus TaxID=420336 RepID=UPI00016C0F14|nr:PhoH family protein [Candidatus Epulopiscium viviparus]